MCACVSACLFFKLKKNISKTAYKDHNLKKKKNCLEIRKSLKKNLKKKKIPQDPRSQKYF